MSKMLHLILISSIFFNYTYANPLFVRHINKLNQDVSFLGLGTVELGRDWGIDKKISIHPSEEAAHKILVSAYKNGMTVFDTATSYQLSEERIGKYLPRAHYNYLLITKPGESSITPDDPRCKVPAYDHQYCRYPAAVYDFSRAALIKDVNESLKKLNVTSIDVLLLHLDSKTAEVVLKKGEAIATLQELKRQGKVRFIGVSINGPAAKQAIETNAIDVIELEYNLLNQTNKESIDLAYQKGMGVIVRGGLGTGLLTKHVAKHLQDTNLPFGDKVRALVVLTHHDYKKLSALALAFLYQNPHISTVIVGADQGEYIKEDIQLLKNFKDQSLLAKAESIVAQYKTPDYFTEVMGEYYQEKFD